jgi:ABC-type Mn2+/Zn2+ transport system ATPase subunit
VSFTAHAGELTAVLGPNGAGKSTFINAVAGLLPLKAGTIKVLGGPVDQVRDRIAYVPQRDRVNWRFPVTAREVVLMGRTRRLGLFRRPGRADHLAVARSLERVGMAESAGSAMEELSGGQRQRIFLARALAQEAEIFLLDEALSAIDVAAQEALLAILRQVTAEGKTVVLATHDLQRVARRCDTCLCLNCHVCAAGPPAEALVPDVLAELYAIHDPSLLATAGTWMS